MREESMHMRLAVAIIMTVLAVTTVLVSGCQVSAESREVNEQLHTGELSMSVVDSVIISEKLNSSGSFPGTFLADKLSGYFGESIELKSGDPVSGSVWMGYLEEAPEEIRASVGEFDQEGYIIRAVKTEEGLPILIITSPSYRGLLYGAGEYEKQLKLTHKVWYDFDVKSEPAFDIRNLWFWSNADFSAEGFVFGHMREPYKHQKFRDLGDLFVSMKINAITLGGRIGEGDTGVDRFIAEAYKEFTKFLRLEYGIDTYVFMLYELSERWGFDMSKIGGGHAYSGLCVHNPSLHRYWEERIDALYEKIPDLGGIVMAGAGGDWVRGPWECRCEQCSKHTHRELVLMAIKMIADPLAKHGGKLMYKNVTDRPTMVTKEVELFADLEGLLPDNVVIMFKNYYNDFRPTHPNNPLFYNIEALGERYPAPYVTEFQIYGEYRGHRYFPAVMTERWTPQFRLAEEKNIRGVIGAAWLSAGIDHPINIANWYSFGELAWDPYREPDDILYEWAVLQYGKEAAPYIVDIAKLSIQASIKTFFMKGIRVDNHSALPSINWMLESSIVGPWHDLPRNDDGMVGRGNDMSAYPQEIIDECLNNPDMLLFTSRVPLTPELVAEAIGEKEEAVELVEEMIRILDDAEPFLPTTYETLRKGLEKNVIDSKLFKESVALYLTYKSGEMTRSQLREWLDNIKTTYTNTDGSRVSDGIRFDRFIEEWEQVYAGTFMRRVMEGQYWSPPVPDFPPGFKDE